MCAKKCSLAFCSNRRDYSSASCRFFAPASSSRCWIYGDTTNFFGFFSKSVAVPMSEQRNERRGKNSNCKIGLLKVTKCHSQSRETRQSVVAEEEKCTRVNDAEILRRRRRKRSRDWGRTEVYTDINSKCHICFRVFESLYFTLNTWVCSSTSHCIKVASFSLDYCCVPVCLQTQTMC